MIPSKSYSFTFFLLFLLGGAITAQEDKFNRFSIELTTGFHIPLTPDEGVVTSDYIAFKQIQIAGRYMIFENYGLKAHYAFNDFVDKNNKEKGITYNRIGLEGVVNLGKALNIDYSIRKNFGMLFHTGAGVTYAYPVSKTKKERIGNFLVGLTGELNLINNFTFLGDVTYVGNFRQHYAYSGENFPNSTYQKGGFVNISVGIMYSLGTKEMHVDWY